MIFSKKTAYFAHQDKLKVKNLNIERSSAHKFRNCFEFFIECFLRLFFGMDLIFRFAHNKLGCIVRSERSKRLKRAEKAWMED